MWVWSWPGRVRMQQTGWESRLVSALARERRIWLVAGFTTLMLPSIRPTQTSVPSSEYLGQAAYNGRKTVLSLFSSPPYNREISGFCEADLRLKISPPHSMELRTRMFPSMTGPPKSAAPRKEREPRDCLDPTLEVRLPPLLPCPDLDRERDRGDGDCGHILARLAPISNISFTKGRLCPGLQPNPGVDNSSGCLLFYRDAPARCGTRSARGPPPSWSCRAPRPDRPYPTCRPPRPLRWIPARSLSAGRRIKRWIDQTQPTEITINETTKFIDRVTESQPFAED